MVWLLHLNDKKIDFFARAKIFVLLIDVDFEKWLKLKDVIMISFQKSNEFNTLLRREGVQGQKLWKLDFQIKGNPKGPLRGPTLWSGFEAPEARPLGTGVVATPFCPPIRAQKIEIGNCAV